MFFRKKQKVDVSDLKIPRHVAIIMDGNGRWAKKRGLPRSAGHRAGVEALRDIIRMSSDLGMEVLSVYAFSTENKNRPKTEVSALMSLLVEFLYKEIDELHEENVHIQFMGEPDGIPKKCIDAIAYAVEKTRDNTGLTWNVAFNYGGRAEMVRAIQQMANDVKESKMDANAINEDMISDYLYTKGLPDPDLVIRTSGEMRLSNFMLYQSSYSELYIPETLWPDFDRKEYEKALRIFNQRKRRFGKVEEA